MRLLSAKVAGEVILFETDDALSVPMEPHSDDDGELKTVAGVEDIRNHFDKIKKAISVLATGIHDAIEGIPKASKVQVEFGIKLAGESGVPLLTKASGEASLKVQVEWTK